MEVSVAVGAQHADKWEKLSRSCKAVSVLQCPRCHTEFVPERYIRLSSGEPEWWLERVPLETDHTGTD